MFRYYAIRTFPPLGHRGGVLQWRKGVHWNTQGAVQKESEIQGKKGLISCHLLFSFVSLFIIDHATCRLALFPLNKV